MKKTLLVLALSLICVFILCFAISAETKTVVDDGTADITLGECVIEGLDRELPNPSRGFTYELDTETKTARITSWANSADTTLGKTFSVPSTVTYEGIEYSVTAFSAVGRENANNNILINVAIPDSVKALPNNAFDGCRALRYIYIGSGVETIGLCAFRYAGFTADSSIEDDGAAKGNVREFIWKTTKITTLSESCFYHMDFNQENNIIEFPFEKITVYGNYCMAYNQHAFQTAHNFNRPLFIDMLDLRNVEFSSTSFEHASIAKTIIINADQINKLSPQTLRGQGAVQPEKYSTFVICGGETKESAVTLTSAIWTANAFYWHPGDIHYNIVFNGYVNAYDGTDGLENQNVYGRDVVDYFFESEDAFAHYISTLNETTNRIATYKRYAKNTNGYFNVCTVVDGVHSFKAYNLRYTDETDTTEEKIEIVEHAQTSFSFGYPQNVKALNNDCTPSTLCWCCDTVLVAGAQHSLNVTITYENGYLNSGDKVTLCTNENCTYCESQKVSALFVCKGYSFSSNSFLQGFGVNIAALAEYQKNIGASNIEYGILAASEEKVGATLFNGSTPAKGVLSVDYSTKSYDIIEMKITGMADEFKAKPIYLCAYIIVNGKVKFISDGAEGEAVSPTSYNDLVGTEIF